MKKTLLVVIGSLNRGGTEGHVAQVFSNINRKHYSIIVYTTSHKGVLAPMLAAHGIKIITPPCATQLKKLGKLGKYFLYFLSSLKLSLLMLRLRPAVVHCFLPGAYLLGGVCAVATRCSKLVMSRRSLNYYQSKHRLFAYIERWLHRKTDLIIGNSRAVIQQLRDEGVSKEKMVLLYNGVDLEKFTNKNITHTHDVFTMIIVANLFAYKGHVDLLHALAAIKAELPKKWRLLCVGKDAGMKKQLQALTNRLKLADHIEWLGERSDVPSLLSCADMGVLCSHEEGFSNSILENMAMGLPMVVTDVGGNAEAVWDGVHGLVVSPKNPTQLAQAILTLAHDEKLRQRMATAAHERACQCFSLEGCVHQYEMQYATLLTAPLCKNSETTQN